MRLLEITWVRMFLLVWGVLLAFAVPLAVLTPIWSRRGKNVKAMWVKYGAWFIMVPVLTIPACFHRVVMQVALLLLSLYAFEEFSRAVGLWKHRAHVWLARIGILMIYVPVLFPWFSLFMTMPAYVVMLVFLFPIARDKYEGMIQRSCLAMLGVIYFGWFLAHLAFLMNVAEGRAMVLAFFLVVIVNDASAYLIGSTVGKRLVSPNISPKKTVEGVLGSAAVSIGMIFAVRFALPCISLPDTILLGFVLGVGGTCGDLTISLIKRDVGVKDMGTLIPGHGGLLDRLDSILFTAPIFFHFLKHFCRVLGTMT